MSVDYYLFDAPGTVYKGGSGVTFDWELLKDSGIPADKIILAGGLNVENVEKPFRRVKPYMVDVSSGVEQISEKMRRYSGIYTGGKKGGEIRNGERSKRNQSVDTENSVDNLFRKR